MSVSNNNTVLKKQATKKNKKLLNHGHERLDPYHWMNKRDESAVLDYIELENKHARDYFNRLKPLEEKLLTEFENRIDPNESSSPIFIQGNQYQFQQKEGFDYGFIYQLKEQSTTLFFDENIRAKGQKFYDLGDWSPSLNNKILAVSEDVIGRRNYVIQFRDNATETYFDDRIENTDGSIVWANDNKTIFYVRKDPDTLREYQVWRHQIGDNPDTDVLVYEETDEKFYVFVNNSMTRKYIQIGVYSSLTSEIHLIDADAPLSSSHIFLPREENHLYSVDFHENGFYITSNKKAKNKQILFSSKIPKTIADCELIQAHSEEILIENLLVFKDHLVVDERVLGINRFKIIRIDNRQSEFISFNEETYTLGFIHNDDYLGGKLYYSYTSLTVPPSVFSYILNSGERQLIHEKKLIDPVFKSIDYISERIWATAKDGVKVPVSVVYHKDTVLSTAPLLLYGYGSYGYTIPDGFSATRISILNRGFVFGIAHIRGGKYLGENWYDEGKFLKKKNTFTDFIAVAEHLRDIHYCSPTKIYAMGGSAGGLLMGAIANMVPQLWKGVISQVPFVDVVTTMLDETIPLTVGEYEEWGNPKEKLYYDYMLSYSPYDNIEKKEYPAMFITTGYHDSQVQYWEPLKYVAKLRDQKTDSNPLIFECNMDAGHGGGSGRSAERKEIARIYTFVLDLEGFAE